MLITNSQSFLYFIALAVFEILATALVIGFTVSNSPFRLGFLPIIATAALYIYSACSVHIQSVFWTSLIVSNAITYLLRYLELVLISKWSSENKGPSRSLARSEGETQGKQVEDRDKLAAVLPRLKFGLETTLFARNIGTAYEVKGTPRFSNDDPSYVPSKTKFLVQKAVVIVITYLVVDLSISLAQPEENPFFFSPRRIHFLSRLNEISGQELAIRVGSTLALGVNVICIFHFGYSILAFIAVISGMSEVTSWRPPFGSLVEAYSLRRFWG